MLFYYIPPIIMPRTSNMHFCSVQANLGEEMCCQLVLLLNVPDKVPFCEPNQPIAAKARQNGKNFTLLEINEAVENQTASISTLFQRSYPKFGPPPPSMNLKVPPDEVPEEHLTFLFGVFMLISMAVICTLFLMKLAKASGTETNRFNARCLGAILPSDYSLMLWVPGGTSRVHHRQNGTRPAAGAVRRRPSLFVLLRSSFRCGGGGSTSGASTAESVEDGASNGTNNHGGIRRIPLRTAPRRLPAPVRGRSCLSIVSSSSMNALLPNSMTPSSSSGSAGLVGLAALNANTSASSTAGAGGMPPPPCYEELEEFSTPRDEIDEKDR